MMQNHKLAKAISDTGWGMFVNFLSYKLEREKKYLLEIDRWFASSKICSHYLYQMDKMTLDIREWTCPSCQTKHDRDENAAKNIRAEGIRILKSEGTPDSARGGSVRPNRGRKTKTMATPSEAGNPTRLAVG